MMKHIAVWTIMLCSLLNASAQTSNDFWTVLPNPLGWVNDYEDIFTPREEKRLTQLIAAYENKTAVEIAVVSIPVYATEKNRFDSLTLHIGNSWHVGKKFRNNGILIGVSKGHRIIRIQNGDGIVQKLSNEQTQQIVDQIFIPNFKANRYYKGVYKGIQEIKKRLGNRW